MKIFNQFKVLTGILLTIVILGGCQDEDQEFGEITTPTNLTIQAEIVGADANNPNGDGSGFVQFTATADNALAFRFNFGDNTDNEPAPNGTITHRFTQTGVNSYNVVVVASGTGGSSTSQSVTVDVFSAFDDQEAKNFLTGGANQSKTWYWADDTTGHLGVGPSLDFDIQINGGPSQFYFPAFFAAAPGQICDGDFNHCLCTDELVFSLDSDNQLTYQLNNNGETFFNSGHQDVVGGSVGEDACFAFDTSGTKFVSLAPTSVDTSLIPDLDFEYRGTTMNFSDDGFMGYFISSSTYDIISISDDEMYVRTIDGLNPDLAWYHRFTTTPPGQNDTGGLCGGSTGETGNGDLTTLVWADEFDEPGAPCSENWGYELGDGCPDLCGWGNNESQFYTSEADNVIVEDGILKITAIAESINGYDYSSTRLSSENLFEFTYGRVEVRAKMPTGAGTWPAIWLFGEDYRSNPWPGCGEIDIMEHIGNNQDVVYGSLHYPGRFGGNADGDTTVISGLSNDFHVYSVEWTPQSILFFVDGVQFHSYNNNSNSPFNNPFFIRLNVAMGGNFGGAIDPAFMESTMEIDYIRVYQ